MQSNNIRSDDDQRMPNMTLSMAIDVDPEISTYSLSETFLSASGNAVHHSLSPLSEHNFQLPELERASAEQFQDVRQHITQLEGGQSSQSAARSEFSWLNSEENGTNSTFNVNDFDRLIREREQEDFEEANLPGIRAAEYRATLRQNSVLTVNDEAEMPNESISLARAPIEDVDPSIN